MDDEKPLLTCDTCKQSCSKKSKLIQHIKKYHSKDSPYVACHKRYGDSIVIVMKALMFPCNLCKKRFVNKKMLETHNSMHHAFGKFVCDHCSKIFTTRVEIHRHISSVTQRAAFKGQCTICDKVYKDKQSFHEHYKYAHSNCEEVKCETCLRTYKNDRALRKHRRKCQQPITKIQCDQCGLYMAKSSLFAHVRAQHAEDGKKLIECQICHKKLSLQNIQNHIKMVHTENDPLECKLCGKYYKNQASLDQHMKIKHDNSGKEHICALCNRKLSSSAKLMRHVRSFHTEDERVCCEICNKDFKNIDAVKSHMYQKHSKHSVESKCKICLKVYPTLVALRYHVKLVHGGQMFTCPDCGKQVKTAKSLRKHTVFTHGVARFECKWCGDRFKWKKRYTDHINQHINGKIVYTCQICDKKYEKIKCYKTHLKNHDTPKLWNRYHKTKCLLCTNTFVSPMKLRYHLFKEHKQPLEEFTCDVCFKKFGNKTLLKQHKYKHDKHLSCFYCEGVFFNMFKLYTHVLQMHFSTNFPCIFCPDQQKNFKHLVLHMQEKHFASIGNKYEVKDELFDENFKVECKMCFMTFIDRKEFNKHLSMSHKQVVILCDSKEKQLCDKYFETSELFHQPNDEGLWVQCKICLMSFKGIEELQNHLSMSHKQAVILCDTKEKELCDKKSENSIKLEPDIDIEDSSLYDYLNTGLKSEF